MNDTRKVSDPHSSTEEHYDQQRRPGGTNPPKDTVEPNDWTNDGEQLPKPDYRRKKPE